MDIQLLISAFLVGLACYFGAIETPWLLGMSGGFYIMGRPLVAGLIVGLIFGDVTTGVLCGLAVQGVFIANLSTGGATNSEITYAGYGGIGIAMATTQDPALAVTLSVLVGQTFGLIFFNTRMALFSYWTPRAEKAARELDEKGIVFNQVWGPQIAVFCFRVIPIMLLVYFGQGFVAGLLEYMPAIFTTIISTLGGVLPALGIGMLMNIIIKEKIQLVYFLAGFAIIAFLKVNIIALVIFAMLVAYLVYLSLDNKGKGEEQEDEVI